MYSIHNQQKESMTGISMHIPPLLLFGGMPHLDVP